MQEIYKKKKIERVKNTCFSLSEFSLSLFHSKTKTQEFAIPVFTLPDGLPIHSHKPLTGYSERERERNERDNAHVFFLSNSQVLNFFLHSPSVPVNRHSKADVNLNSLHRATVEKKRIKKRREKL